MKTIYLFFLLIAVVGVMIFGILYSIWMKEDVRQVSPTSHQPLKIYASFYPLAFLTKEIVGDRGDVINLAGEREVHEYQIDTDLKKIYQADFLVYQGAGLESWLNVLPQLKKKEIPILAIFPELLSLLKLTTAEQDPHTWLDPVLVQAMIELITRALVSLDPDHQALFRSQAERLKEVFAQIDVLYRDRLKGCHRKEAIVSHDAFEYVSSRYGFKLYSLAGISPHDEPSAKILVELEKLAKVKKISTILVEKNNIEDFAKVLAEASNLVVIPISSLERDDPTEGDFLKRFKGNLNYFAQALACP